METIFILSAAVAGTIAGCAAGCIPGFHVYNLLGVMITSFAMPDSGNLLPPLFIGMIVGWTMTAAIPSVLLAAPDESALLMVLPGQKYAGRGEGFEAAMLTAAGALLAAFLLVIPAGLLIPILLPEIRTTLRPHGYWVLWSVIAFLLLSEWPKLGTRGQGGWRRFIEGCSTPAAGILTFLMAGMLGLVLRYNPPFPPKAALHGMMPAFAGLFAVPWLLLNIVSRFQLPRQEQRSALRASGRHILRGTAAGCLGGGFAALFPGVSGGIGGLLAGHATAQRDDRVFLVSQGASRMIYYAGALLLMFLPETGYSRGTGAFLLGTFYEANGGMNDYLPALGSIAVAAALSFLLMRPLLRLTLWCVNKFGFCRISTAALSVVIGLVFVCTGFMGLLVLAAATGIGLIPVLFHSRRINCLGVILLPAALGMSELGPVVASALGIIR